MRITAYADRLLADLDVLDWTDSIKQMQRNWIGRSTGANVRFAVDGFDDVDIEVFTTRPDTLFGATYMVLAPEHPLVDVITANEWPDDERVGRLGEQPARRVEGRVRVWSARRPRRSTRYREFAAAKTDLERQSEGREKTGVFTGAFAINPVNEQQIPVFIADYVLMGYGTGAIMAVPGAGRTRLGVRRGVRPADHPHRAAARRLRRQGVHRRRPGDQQRASSTASASPTRSAR